MTRISKKGKQGFARQLLNWYDDHARSLPWRVGPQARLAGTVPDPYHVWLSEVMLQQTTVATVTPRFAAFLARWPRMADLARAPQEDVLGEWAGLGYYARARNLHACAMAVLADHDGVLPNDIAALQALPGIGQYTSAAIAAIAFDQRAVVVDGNVARIIVRQFFLNEPIKDSMPEIYAYTDKVTPPRRVGDYAQAMMDLGATICRPQSPRCVVCPVQASCDAYHLGLTEVLPRKAAKKPKPIRVGVVYAARRKDGAVLAERRAATGLYGGMLGLPGSAWQELGAGDTAVDVLAQLCEVPPIRGAWVDVGEVHHTLTHFKLIIRVRTAAVARATKGLVWLMPEGFSALPTVFRKAAVLPK